MEVLINEISKILKDIDLLILESKNIKLQKKLAYKNIVINQLNINVINEKISNKLFIYKKFRKKDIKKYIIWLVLSSLGLVIGILNNVILTLSFISLLTCLTFSIKKISKLIVKNDNIKRKMIKKCYLDNNNYEKQIKKEMTNIHELTIKGANVQKILNEKVNVLKDLRNNLEIRTNKIKEESLYNYMFLSNNKVKRIVNDYYIKYK